MRTLVCAILTIGMAIAAGQTRRRLITIAPTIRWPNARRRLPAAQRSVAPTQITPARRRRCDETTAVIVTSDQCRSCPP